MGSANLARTEEPDRIAIAARHVQRMAERSGLEVGLAIGRYLLETFYDGDYSQFHSRGGGPTLRALAAHPDLELSATYLYSSVAISEQVQSWPEALVHALSFSHHRELLSVRDPDARRRLAVQCWESSWSCSVLSEEIRRRFPAPPTRRGRPRTPAVARCASGVRSQLELLGSGDWEDAERLFGRLGSDEAMEFVEAALRDATELGHRLRRLRVLARSRR